LPGKLPIFYSALLLTGVNLLLRLVGTSFQVYLSGKIGPAGIGLLQLVMSVGSLAMIAGMAGIRTASMYLTAEELGKKRNENVPWVLSGCFQYSILCSGIIAVLLIMFSSEIAEFWIGDIGTAGAIRLFGGFLPSICLCGVMTGYFTAEGKIGMLAGIGILEQLVSLGVTMAGLSLWAGTDALRAIKCVISGSGVGSILTLCILVTFRNMERGKIGSKKSVRHPLLQTAIPLAVADILKSGITTTESLMVPKRLEKNVTIENPLAAFGLVSGMVFPVLMFPACVIYGLAELLIPELARCTASGSEERICYLVRRSLKTVMLYGLFFSGFLFLLSEPLCLWLYQNSGAGECLKLYSILVPMLYCDAITDAMTKGMGQQKTCVRYNILSSAMDVVLLYVLLPRYGMEGYFFSFAITHLFNFILSLRRLLRITQVKISTSLPILSIVSEVSAVFVACHINSPVISVIVFITVFFCILILFSVIEKEDAKWIRGMLRFQTKPA